MRRTLWAGLFALAYLAALLAAYLFAPAEFWGHIKFYVFVVVFALVAVGGVMLLEANALATGRPDDSTGQEVEYLAESAAGGFLVGLVIGGTVLLTMGAVIGLAG